MINPSETGRQMMQSVMARRKVMTSAAIIAAVAASAGRFSNPSLAQSGNLKEAFMSAERNAELVRRGYHAFNTADVPLLRQILDANCTWETPGKSPVAGQRKGIDNVLAQFGTYGGGSDGTFKAELQYVTADADGRVVGVHRNTGSRKGRTLDTLCCIVFQLENGRVVSGKEHFFDLYNWDAFWA